MRVLILGGDGYLGWPTAMRLARNGHDVLVADDYSKRALVQKTNSEPLNSNPNLPLRTSIFEKALGKKIKYEIGGLTQFPFISGLFERFRPDSVVHFAEQPSGPYSMMGFEEASYTLNNNLNVTLNTVFALLKHTPNCHLVKLGTMGEYGTPNIDIEEGWIDIQHKGRSDRFLFPRQAGSLYHTTKILDTDLLWFYVRAHGLTVTDLMQGPVYGIETDESEADSRLMTSFHYDDIFGTVLNRFLAQAVTDTPLTVYGEGGQTRGYLCLKDSLSCIELAINHPPKGGEMRIFNQFTETFSVNDLATKVQRAGASCGLNVRIQNLKNPRKEKESHHYNPAHIGLLDLGLKPSFMTDQVLAEMLKRIRGFRDRIQTSKFLPREPRRESHRDA